MSITPNEMSNKEFKKSFRGYDADEVDEFIAEIIEDYEKLYKDNMNLREKMAALNEKLEHYANIEQTLQNTLVLAQRAAEQAKENSKAECELIKRNAQEDALQIKRQAERDVEDITKKYEMVKQEYSMFRSRFKGLLQGQIEAIESSSEEFNVK